MTDDPAGHVFAANLADVPEGGCLAVDVGGRPLVLVRRGDAVHALENRCPHAGAPLSEGFVEGPHITCAWHGWTFVLATGESADQTGLEVPTFPVAVVEGRVLVRV